MKLLFCPDCGQVFSLSFHLKSCDCGKCCGKYVDRQNAVVNGEGVALAIGNGALQEAIFRALGFNAHHPMTAREEYQTVGNIQHAWVRPHEGPGNPHTKVVKDLALREALQELTNIGQEFFPEEYTVDRVVDSEGGETE